MKSNKSKDEIFEIAEDLNKIYSNSYDKIYFKKSYIFSELLLFYLKKNSEFKRNDAKM